MSSKAAPKVLKDLLDETKDEPIKDLNFNKIMSLIEKSKQMKKEEKMRLSRTNDYFKQLKEKLAESTTFLSKARKDMDNISAVKARKIPEIETAESYDALMKMSDSEIEAEIANLRSQLELLDKRVKTYNQHAQNADEFYKKSMKTLTDINRKLSEA